MIKFSSARIKGVVDDVVKSVEASKGRLSEVNLDILKGGENDYFGVQVTAIPSVNRIEPHYVDPRTTSLINNNGDAWDTDVLKNTIHTLVGKPNYMEHQHNEESLRGIVLDTVAYPVDSNGVEVYYADALIAVHKKFASLINYIKAGKICVSIGASVEFTQCTKCGKILRDDESCEHIPAQKGVKFSVDGLGDTAIAELCGSGNDLSSNEFFEISWVAAPAFRSAVIQKTFGSIKKLSSDDQKRIINATQNCMLKQNIRVASTDPYDSHRLSLKTGVSEATATIIVALRDIYHIHPTLFKELALIAIPSQYDTIVEAVKAADRSLKEKLF